ncbi:MAG TPA: SAM-dependent chlorinase/fluorinase [Polyangiaceae bacterium]|nr:SAM-dependent chlorinase/fluorinase [Polyangiaceae bacterium]
MQAACGLLTFLTDFGLVDPFVGVMKGVVSGAHPSLRLIDLTHGIRPGAVAEGAFWLERSYRHFPAGSVHCAVVDPGVGSSRAAVVVAAERHFFVGPDNGLLAEVTLRAPHVETRLIDRERLGLRQVSNTFHGRDVFGVVAGRLAAQQLAFADVGELVHLQVPSPIPGIVSEADGFVGTLVTADHFGNLITSLRASEVLPSTDVPFRVSFAGKSLRSVRTFADAAPGELVALVGSFDAVELVVRDGSALERLRPVPGASVKLYPS